MTRRDRFSSLRTARSEKARRTQPMTGLGVGLGLGLLGVAALVARKLIQLQIPAYFQAAPIRELRPEPAAREAGNTEMSAERSSLLIVALDGVGRDLLYEMLHAGELPGLARLLGGGQARGFSNAFFHTSLMSVLPAATSTNWASLFTGQAPGVHGMAGNEFFIREQPRFVAPIPVTSQDPKPIMSSLIADYTDELLSVPTIYQRMRESDPDINIWVSLHMLHAGANRFLLTPRMILAEIAGGLWKLLTRQRRTVSALFEKADRAALNLVMAQCRRCRIPDVLTVYCPGTDLYAHKASGGPERAVKGYLKEVLDDRFAALHDTLEAAGALDNRFIAVVSDHGQSETHADTTHALTSDQKRGAAAVLKNVGFRVRPFDLEVPDERAFHCVIGNQQAFAFIYLTDRSCGEGDEGRFDWQRPPRFSEDVLTAAEAFHQANLYGTHDVDMRGTLDLILVRRPVPWHEPAQPFEVYQGNGRSEPLQKFLRQHPRPQWLAFERRLREMTEGPQGHRAGDLILMAHWGQGKSSKGRYYFSHPMQSAHGGPSRADSEIPLILAHPRLGTRQLGDIVNARLGNAPLLYDVGNLLVHLREMVVPSAEGDSAVAR